MQNFIEELTWRGMLHSVVPGTEEQLKKECTLGYIGFDPTADSLHIGNLVQIMMLVHFQNCGHRPVILLGGATGLVGDPSGKSQERKLLDKTALDKNLESIKKQLSKFLDFNGNHAALIVNNYDWFERFHFLDFIRDVGKHITINYMMAKDSVKNRFVEGISFTEFSYQLVQGYDFYHLFVNKGVKMQLGGSDQWGNILTGIELIRKKTGGKSYAITSPLVTKSDGVKFGKTEEGNLWLDASKTSSYKFYQYWLNLSDEDAEKYSKIFSLKQKDELDMLIQSHREAPHERKVQRVLAMEITARVHTQKEAEMAVKASGILFGKSTTSDLSIISEHTLLEIFEGVPQIEIQRNLLKDMDNVATLLSQATQYFIFKSKGEAKKMIQGGGMSINKIKIQDPSHPVDFSLIHDKYLLVQKGRKNYFLINVI